MNISLFQAFKLLGQNTLFMQVFLRLVEILKRQKTFDVFYYYYYLL